MSSSICLHPSELAKSALSAEQLILRESTRWQRPSHAIAKIIGEAACEAEDLLANMEQGASEPLLDSFLPVMKALISDSLLKHSVEGIRVSVKCCLTELLRISVPQEMFNDDQIKVIFELIVEAFLKLSQASRQYYEKALSILETVARVKACLLMLDLKCDALVVQMFQTFWEIIRFYDGLIQSYDPLMKKHKVLYDDGDKETLNLEEERRDFIEDDLPVEHRHVADNPIPITSPVILRKQNGNKAEWE